MSGTVPHAWKTINILDDTRTVVQQVKPPLETPACHIKVLIQFPHAQLPIPLPNNALEKAAEDGTYIWTHAMHMGDPD